MIIPVEIQFTKHRALGLPVPGALPLQNVCSGRAGRTAPPLPAREETVLFETRPQVRDF